MLHTSADLDEPTGMTRFYFGKLKSWVSEIAWLGWVSQQKQDDGVVLKRPAAATAMKRPAAKLMKITALSKRPAARTKEEEAERKRVHSRAYHATRVAALAAGKSDTMAKVLAHTVGKKALYEL